MRTTINRKDSTGEYKSIELIGVDELKTEIEALIAEADSDLEMVMISNFLQKKEERDAVAREHDIYVQALKDLATRLGVDVE